MVMSLVGAEELGASVQPIQSEKRFSDPDTGTGPGSPLDERRLAARVAGLGLRSIGAATGAAAMFNLCRLTNLFCQFAHELHPKDESLVTLSPMATKGICVHEC